MSRGKGRTQASRMEHARRKAERATFLRVAQRKTWQQVAESLLPCPAHEPNGQQGCELCARLYASPGAAHKAVTNYLEREHEVSAAKRDELRREHLASLEVLLQRGIRDALTAGDVSERMSATRTVRQLMDQRARILGLYAPTQVQLSDSELDAAIEAELAALAELPPVDERTMREH